MPDYRRNRVPGGTYFFTVNLQNRQNTLLTDNIQALRNAVATTRRQRPFHIDAWVVLPNHLHALWTLPENDTDYSGRWRAIKKAFSKSLEPTEARSRVNEKRHERAIWQRRFWEHTIRNDDDYATHVNYIHFNPVKHGYTQAPDAWPYSTFHQAVKQGLHPPNWHPTPPDEGN